MYNMLDLPPQCIFYDNQVRASGKFYDDKPNKLGGKQQLVTTYGRESCMFIIDGLSYLPARFPTNEEMDSYTNVPLTLAEEWKP